MTDLQNVPAPSAPDKAASPSDVTPPRGGPTLSGRMGPGALALTVLAFSAPLTTVAGFIPFSITFGGVGAPLAFIVTTVLMVVFCVGYLKMTKYVPKPGDFYSFISSGLGRIVGLGAGFMSTVSYMVILVGVFAFVGINTSNLITSLHGPTTSWWIWAVAGWALISALGYFHIELSARILSIIMIIEVLVVVVFNVAVFARGGAEGLSAASFSPTVMAHGDISVTLLYTTMVFLGFEATALFRDEVRDPDKTIPRATYSAVIFIGVLYTLSCYALISAYGSQAVQKATDAPAGMFSDAIGTFLTPALTQISLALVLTSVAAAMLSIHNVLSRYVHNLGYDKALPKVVAKVHPRHGSPHTASNVVAGVGILGLLPFILTNADAATLYGRLTGLGSVGVIALMALVSLAVIAWFARNGVPAGESFLKVFVAPAVSVLALGFIVVFALLHFDLVVGGQPGENTGLELILAGSLIAGIVLATYFRYARPHVYAGLGRADRAFGQPTAVTD